MKNKVMNKKVKLISLTLILILSIFSCKQYKFNLEEWYEYWTKKLGVSEIEIKAPYNFLDGIYYVPSHVTDNRALEVILNIDNKDAYNFLSVYEKPEMLKFNEMPRPKLKPQNYTGPPNGSYDYTFEQINDKQIKVIFTKKYVLGCKRNNKDMGFTIELFHESGRPFVDKFNFKLIVNTPPPTINDVKIAKTIDNEYYVLCFEIPDSEMRYTDGESEDQQRIHNDLKYLLTGIDSELDFDKDLPFKANSDYDSFESTDTNRFLRADQVTKLNGIDPELPTGQWAVFFRTNRKVNHQNPAKKYKLQIIDQYGLKSPRICEIMTPAGKPLDVKAYPDTDNSPNIESKIVICDKAANTVNINGNSTVGSTEDNPIMIHITDCDTDKIPLLLKTESQNVKISYTLENMNNSSVTSIAGTNPNSSATLNLEADRCKRIKYKLTITSGGEGYTDAERTIYYTVDYRYNLKYNNEICFNGDTSDPFNVDNSASLARYHYSGTETKIDKAETDGYKATEWYYTSNGSTDGNTEAGYSNKLKDGNIIKADHDNNDPTSLDILLNPKWQAEKVDYKVEYYWEEIYTDEYSTTVSDTKTYQDFSNKNTSSSNLEDKLVNYEYKDFEVKSAYLISPSPCKINRHGTTVFKVNAKRLLFTIKLSPSDGKISYTIKDGTSTAVDIEETKTLKKKSGTEITITEIEPVKSNLSKAGWGVRKSSSDSWSRYSSDVSTSITFNHENAGKSFHARWGGYRVTDNGSPYIKFKTSVNDVGGTMEIYGNIDQYIRGNRRKIWYYESSTLDDIEEDTWENLNPDNKPYYSDLLGMGEVVKITADIWEDDSSSGDEHLLDSSSTYTLPDYVSSHHKWIEVSDSDTYVKVDYKFYVDYYGE